MVSIDPALIPLPDEDDDDDLIPQPKKKKRRATAAEKGKGKQVPVSDEASKTSKRAASSSAAQSEPKRQKGRAVGAGNYSMKDVDALLDILARTLPMGGKGWNSATDEFNEWAEENERPTRSAKSLELKYKQVCVSTFMDIHSC